MADLLRIPTFTAAQQVVDREGRFTAPALSSLNRALQQIATAINAIAAIPEIAGALANLDQVVQDAQQAITDAQTAISDTQAQNRETALQSSYIDPESVLLASPTTITVASHTRVYGDGTSVTVVGGTVPATAPGDVDYVFYDDPGRTGGAVTYQASTAAPTQTGNRHVVGAVNIPATGSAPGGKGPRPPGTVQP